MQSDPDHDQTPEWIASGDRDAVGLLALFALIIFVLRALALTNGGGG